MICYNDFGDSMKLNEEQLRLFVAYLTEKKETVATMESCTGGMLASAITDIPGASQVFESGWVTYSNRMKEICGVSQDVIDTYGVYSKEVAYEMARVAATFASATYGIGITGRLSMDGKNNIIYICLYHLPTKKTHYQTVSASLERRHDNKISIVNLIIQLFFAFSRDV